MKKIGIVTIGQSPRPDVLRGMKPFFGKSVDVIERGVLDGISYEQVKKFSPDEGMMALVTRMRDGTEVVIAKEKILPKIEHLITELNNHRVNLILILCVGSFPSFESSCLIIYPKRIVDLCVASLIDDSHHLGIMVPALAQVDWVRKNFASLTSQITAVHASPYGGHSRFSQASEILKESDCDLIVMYCMGFTQKFAQEVRIATGEPVILSSSIVARTVGELLQ